MRTDSRVHIFQGKSFLTDLSKGGFSETLPSVIPVFVQDWTGLAHEGLTIPDEHCPSNSDLWWENKWWDSKSVCSLFLGFITLKLDVFTAANQAIHSLGNLEDFHLCNRSSEIVGLLSCLPSALLTRSTWEVRNSSQTLTWAGAREAAVVTSPRAEDIAFHKWVVFHLHRHWLFSSPANVAFRERAVDAKVKLGLIWDQL